MKTKSQTGHFLYKFAVNLTRVIFVAGFLLGARWSWSQSTPVLTIAPTGTNQISFTFTNSPPTTWDLQWTPVLANSEYPWMWVRTGTNGQTNFVVNVDELSGSQTAFFRTILDTNAVPLWQAADPNNPAAGILTVTIDSPTNGAVIQ